MNTLKATIVTLVLAMAMCAPALANPAVGTNPFLPSDGSMADIYIPLQLSTSGVLGDLIGGGPDQVGLDPDSLIVSGANPTTSGDVAFELAFDLTGEIAQGQVITAGTIFLTFRDLDLLQVSSSVMNYQETLTVVLLKDSGDDANGAPSVTIDDTNLNSFLPAPTSQTDETTLTYEIDIINAFFGGNPAAAAAFFADLNADENFALELTMESEFEYLKSAKRTLNNSAEQISTQDFAFFAVPEPATLMMLAMGSVALLRRRKA